MVITAKQKVTILETVDRIHRGIFDETDIRTLLIEVREYTEKDSLFREFAHFIAHYERNSGKFHAHIDYLIAVIKIKLCIPGTKTHFITIDYSKLSKKEFEVIFNTGLQEVPDKYHQKQIGINKKQAKAYVLDSYLLKKGFYELKDSSRLSKIQTIANSCLSILNGLPIMSFDKMIDELNRNLNGVYLKYLPKYRYQNTLKRQSRDVLLCILSLFQNATYTLFDNTPVTSFLSVSPIDYPEGSSQKNMGMDKGNLILNAEFELGYNITNVVHVIGSNIKAEDVLDDVSELSNRGDGSPPVIVARRNDKGELRLVLPSF